jgi:hypothetical protein
MTEGGVRKRRQQATIAGDIKRPEAAYRSIVTQDARAGAKVAILEWGRNGIESVGKEEETRSHGGTTRAMARTSTHLQFVQHLLQAAVRENETRVNQAVQRLGRLLHILDLED